MANIKRRSIRIEDGGLCWDINTLEEGGKVVRM
jgi:hypothetical protein